MRLAGGAIAVAPVGPIKRGADGRTAQAARPSATLSWPLWEALCAQQELPRAAACRTIVSLVAQLLTNDTDPPGSWFETQPRQAPTMDRAHDAQCQSGFALAAPVE